MKRLRGKQIHKGLLNILNEQSHSYATVKNWIGSLIRSAFLFKKDRSGKPLLVYFRKHRCSSGHDFIRPSSNHSSRIFGNERNFCKMNPQMSECRPEIGRQG